MKSFFTFLLIAVFCSCLFAQNPNPDATVDANIQSVMSDEKLPGTSTLIVKGGEIVWIQSYGYANLNTSAPVYDTISFMLASISKVFTGMALMQLYDEGTISLDEDINDYMPFDVLIPGYESTPVTFRMLLTHSSSIQDNWNAMDNYYSDGDPTITLADCIERYFSPTGADYNASQNFLNAAPGTQYEYTNMGAALEGYLVEVISGMPFNEYCNINIFDKLCMYNTRWYISEYADPNMIANPHDYWAGDYDILDHYGYADYPDGMLHSNVMDMANFMIAVLQGGMLNDISLISSTAIDEMLTSQVPSLDPTQGLQFYQETFNPAAGSVTLWGHSGGEAGVSTDMYFDLNEDMGIAVLSNGNGYCTEIVEELYDYGLTLNTSGIGNPECFSTYAGNITKPSIQVYPNPAIDRITFNTGNIHSDPYQIIITDMTGRQINSYIMNSCEGTINLTDYDAGIYFYQITGAGLKVSAGKFVINK